MTLNALAPEDDMGEQAVYSWQRTTFFYDHPAISYKNALLFPDSEFPYFSINRSLGMLMDKYSFLTGTW